MTTKDKKKKWSNSGSSGDESVGKWSGGEASDRAKSHSAGSSRQHDKKYKFHEEYFKDVLKEGGNLKAKRWPSKSREGRHRKLVHEQMDNDAFWNQRYRLVNYRKRHPEAFDQEEFDQFYDWLTDLTLHDSGTGKPAHILFSGHKRGAN